MRTEPLRSACRISGSLHPKPATTIIEGILCCLSRLASSTALNNLSSVVPAVF